MALFRDFTRIWSIPKLDWLRHWRDFHTNNLPHDPGFKPNHAWMYDLVDDVSWYNNVWKASEAFFDVLGGSMQSRWLSYGCWNGISYTHCN